MNHQIFRVIFSRTLQRLVVVSELAKAEGKAGAPLASGAILPKICKIRPLVFQLFCALGFVTFSGNAEAETLIIQADPSAPKNQQPIILSTANGLPQINIQTPNDKGLSHNKYRQFDVAEKGAILNNSRTTAQTQQAGLVQGNPYLARGEAKVILNEVNANKPSQLKGYVEVAGKKADVIIANPSGIHCDGCGIIHSDRVTLTTGKPEIKNGQVDNIRVEAGKVKVSGKGLDNSRVDYTEIISREADINAGVWSKKEAKVITGKNTVKRSNSDNNLQIIHTNQPLAGEEKPTVAIDVGELGGMYAGKIHLIGTEHGVGVRNAGHIGASAETLTIDSQGRIVNTGTFNAEKSVQLNAQHGIDNQGKIENKQGDIQLNSKADIQHSGSIVARGGNIQKQAKGDIQQSGETVAKGNIRYTARQTHADKNSLIAAGVEVTDTAQGEVRKLEAQSATGKTITVATTEKATLQGKHLASGKIDVQGSAINLDHSHTAAYAVSVTAHQGSIQANNATLVADKTLSLSTLGELQTQQSQLKAEKITAQQRSLNTQNAIWEQTGTDELKISVKDQLKNQGGTFKTKGDLTIHSQGADNRQGELISGGKLTLDAGVEKVDSVNGKIRSASTLTINSGELDNTQGAIQSAERILVNTHGQALINQHTLSNETGIVALGTLDLNTSKLDNRNGYVASRSNQTIRATELNNSEGVIQAQQTLEITAPVVENNKGVISAQSSMVSVGSLSNRFGLLQSTDKFSLNAEQVENSNGTISGGNILTLSATDFIKQGSGKIGASLLALNTGLLQSGENSVIAADNATFNIKNTLTNTNSEISATEHLTIDSKAIDNREGLILAEKGDLNIDSQAQQIHNQQGKIVAGETLNIRSGEFNNQQGLVQANHIASLHTNRHTLRNDNGVINSQVNLQLDTANIHNESGIISAQTIDAKFTELEQQQGKIIASDTLNLNAGGRIRSTQQSLIQAKNLTMTGAGLDNQQSEIVAYNSAAIRSRELNNRNGVIVAEQGNLDINTQKQVINNEQGKLSAGSDLTLNSGELNNQQGLIQSRQTMQIDTHQGNLNNQQTQKTDVSQPQQQGIISLGQLAVTTQQFLNQQGYVLSQQAQTINANAIENKAGVLSSLADQTLSITNAILNHQGRISGQQTAITASHIENQDGLIQGDRLLGVQLSGNMDNQSGQLKANQQLDVSASSVNNREGQIRAIEGTLHLTSTERVDNTQGYITSANSSTIRARDLTNQYGLVYNEHAALTLELQQALNNQQGKVISQDKLSVKSDTLLNQQGTLYAQKQADIQANSQIDNQQSGKIHGLGDIYLNTNQLDNRGGEIRTQHSLTLNATSGVNNQKVNETGSLIESGNKLDINTTHLDNSHTTSSAENMAQGILASTLTVTAQTLNNQQGKIHSYTQSDLNVRWQIDNRQGGITGDEGVHIEGSELRLDNQDGRLQAGGKLSLFANEITTNGHIEGRDIELTQQRDFTTGNHIHANHSLSITTAGNLANQHQLYADDSVTLNANHITNGLAGRISSANTRLTAKGNVHNEGLINSISPTDNAETIIKAGGQIVNTGAGRIYGDHIALQADRIENSDKDYGNGSIKSAVIASRGDLDIAAREIDNNTAHYLADNQVGATLFSLGDMRFGRTLNAEHQVEGKADVLRNNSSVIEAQGSIVLNIAQIQNNNIHFEVEHVKTGKAPTNITKLVSRPVSETYIVPMGENERHNLKTNFTNELNGNKSGINSENDPHIPMKLLRWAGWSRAGQLVYKNDGAEPVVLKANDVITKDTPLAIRNEVHCDYIGGKETCNYTPAGQYGADSPIWAYFGATPPTTPQPKFPFDELREQPWFVESEWFDKEGEFKRPSRPFILLGNDRYQAQKVKWDYYVEHIKPLEDWERDNAGSINKVDAGIEKHNRDRLGDLADKYYRDFWRLHISNHREDESKVTKTVAAQILAGGNIDFDSTAFTNDKSVVIAGQNIALKDQIHNIDEEGLHRITDTGDKVFTFDEWRGGFKRYFQRNWENQGPYTRIIETPFDMKLFRVDEQANYDDQKLASNSHKVGETHHLSLNPLSVKGEAFSAQDKQALGNLAIEDQAQFVGLNNANETRPTHWRAQGQSVAVRPLSRIELSNDTEVRSIQPDLAIPQNVLYRLNPNPNSQVLIETDPDFTDKKRWLSSDYMFNALRYEPNQMQKRIGDGFYEQRLIREQINRLTGRQFVGDYTDFDSQYRGLMDAGVTFAQKFNLRPGIALNPEQVAQLTSDIVWFESQSVRLPNGKVETVLVPKVYALAKKGDITGNGTLLSGNSVTHTGGELINNGTVAGRELVRFDSDSIRNSGNIRAGVLSGNVSRNVENIGGSIEADQAVLLNVAGDFIHRSTTHTTEVNEEGYSRLDTRVARKGLLHVKNKEGALQINANNIEISGADIINDGQGKSYLSAKNQLNLTALRTGFDEKMGGGNHYRNESMGDVEISRVQGKGNVVLSGKNIYTEGAELATEERLALLAENELVLGTATQQHEYEEYHKHKKRHIASSSTKERYYSQAALQHKSTVLAAKDIALKASNMTLSATEAVALNNITAIATENLMVDSAMNQSHQHEWEKHKRRGLTTSVANGVASVGIGRSKSGTNEDSTSISLQLSRFKALGNLTFVAENGDLTLNAAQLQSGGNMHLQGSNVSLNALTENESRHVSHYARSSGVGLSMVYSPSQAFKANYGEQANQGSAVGIIGKIFTAADAGAKTANQILNPGGSYATSQRSQQEKNSTQTHAVVTTADAGGNLSVIATQGDIHSQGAQFSAKGEGEFWAKENLNLDVAVSTSGQHSQEKRKGAEFNLGKGSAGAYTENRVGSGESRTEQASVLSFGGNVSLNAQEGNVTFKGTQAVAEGNVSVNAGKDVRITTATSRTATDDNQAKHGVGEAVISETERFNGYHRQLSSENGEQVRHQQALIASLNDSVEINAGNNVHSTSGQMLAKKRIDISGEAVTFDTAHNIGNSQRHNSDLKIGQFARVSSPIIDLIQTVEQAVNNKDASDRVKAAQALGAAAKAYSTAADLANGGALFRAETGTGFSHSRERNEMSSRESVGNQVNAQHINITSRSGDIRATHTAFTSKDAEGNRLKDSTITFNSANDLLLNAGQSEYQMQGKQQSSGFESGTGVAVGAQTGWYFYGQAGFSNGKQEEHHLTHQNSQIDTETLNINTKGDTVLKGATARANRINAEIKGNLTIESPQDEHSSTSNSAGFGGRVQGAIGTAWGASGYGNLASGEANSQKVGEQSGLFAEKGGYHIDANDVELIGGAIASTNPANSELATNNLTFRDIENYSSSQAVSAGLSGSANLNKVAGTEAKTEAQAKQQAEIAKLTGTPQSNGISPSIPMFDSSEDRSITKATLTEGKITLNKDSNPTQTTAKALGINTDLSQANRQVAAPKDIHQKLSEQQMLSQAAGNVAGAVMTYAENQKAELQQAEQKARKSAEQAANAGDSATALTKLHEAEQLKAEAERWETGGDQKRKATAVAAALSLAVAGKPAEAIAAGAASPYLNEAIKHITENTDNKALEALNVPLHILWGAVEAELAGGSATAGAVAAGVGELGAKVLAETVYGKQPSELNEEEKQNLLNASKALAGMASGVVSRGNGAETLANASVGMAVAENAVENNALNASDSVNYLRDLSEAYKKGESLEAVHEKYAILSQREFEKDIEACQNGGLMCYVGVLSAMQAGVDSIEGYKDFYALPTEIKQEAVDWVSTEAAKHSIEFTDGSPTAIYLALTAIEIAQEMYEAKNTGRNFSVDKAQAKFAQKINAYNPHKHSVGNMNDFLKNKEFGQNLSQILTKTSKRYQGQTIYEVNKSELGFKKGDQIYLDNLHKDHLEVFDRNGNFKGVYNLDGSLNAEKTKNSYGRKLSK